MAVITVNERLVKLARVDQSIPPAVSAQPLDAGTYVTQAADGRYVPGGASGGGIVVETVLTANAPISVLKKGILDLGPDLQTRNPGTPVFGRPSNVSPGALDDAATHVDGAATINNVRIGVVEAGRGDLNGDGAAQRRYLRVEA
ncbi:MAG: hypothetical protein M3P49_02890 [Actinomycetota bacterium]|nr:hypothetical protein [Actinomycetota bacterium]